MSLGKFTLGVIVGAAGFCLYEAFKRGALSCCEEEGYVKKGLEKGKEFGREAADKAADAGEKLLHEAEPAGRS